VPLLASLATIDSPPLPPALLVWSAGVVMATGSLTFQVKVRLALARIIQQI